MHDIKFGSQVVYQQATAPAPAFEQISDLCQAQSHDQQFELAVLGAQFAHLPIQENHQIRSLRTAVGKPACVVAFTVSVQALTESFLTVPAGVQGQINFVFFAQ